mmetsp:Transcript_18997/g.28136  ORF Transcript_18997/g.28136 Transcript_18997/m.28136 type:complete len:463 (+) Transcript_18997:180-1568(+)
MATSKSPWTATDVFLKDISAENGKLNGLGGRCLKYYPDKGRYCVRLHYTGRTLLVKEECLVSSKSQEKMRVVPLKGGKRSTVTIDYPMSLNASDQHSDEKAEKRFMVVDEERFNAAIGLIRKNSDYRFALSERVRRGLLEKKEAGALVVNLMKVDETRPIFVGNAHDLIMDERQTVFMTNTEMRKKFGKAYTHGRQLLRHLYDPGLPFPDTVKASALFVKQFPPIEWDDSMAQKELDPSDIEGSKSFFEGWGIKKHVFLDVLSDHFARRMAGENPAMKPESELEHMVMSRVYSRGEYDDLAEIFTRPFMHMFKKPLKKLGKGPLWKDHDEMDGYRCADAFVVFCFHPVSHWTERRICDPQTSDMIPDVVDGWRVLGFESLGLWSLQIRNKLRQAEEENLSDQERLTMFARDSEKPIVDAWLHNGGEFNTNLPSSQIIKEQKCHNPLCEEVQTKAKHCATGKH